MFSKSSHIIVLGPVISNILQYSIINNQSIIDNQWIIANQEKNDGKCSKYNCTDDTYATFVNCVTCAVCDVRAVFVKVAYDCIFGRTLSKHIHALCLFAIRIVHFSKFTSRYKAKSGSTEKQNFDLLSVWYRRNTCEFAIEGAVCTVPGNGARIVILAPTSGTTQYRCCIQSKVFIPCQTVLCCVCCTHAQLAICFQARLCRKHVSICSHVHIFASSHRNRCQWTIKWNLYFARNAAVLARFPTQLCQTYNFVQIWSYAF